MEEPSAPTHSGRGREAADLSTAAMAAGCTVDISGVPVRVWADGDERAGVLAAALGRLPNHPGPPEAEILFGARPPALPEAPPDESYADRFHLWRRGAELYVSYGSEAAGRITALGAEFGGKPTPAFRHLIPLALSHILGFTGRFVVHAGVIERDRTVALVFGDSGSGKSTLAITARLAGWRVLSDDLGIVQPYRGRVRVSSLGLPLTFPLDLLEAPVRGSQPLTNDPRQRWTLAVPRGRTWRYVTDLIAVHRDTATGGSLAPVAPMARFEQAVGAFMAATEPLLLRRYLPTAEALSRRPGWRLGLAPDPSSRLVAATQLLETVLTGQASPEKP